MNINKSFGIMGILAAALACGIPQQAAASGSTGDIRSIEAVGDFPNADNPIKAGGEVKFKIRLLNARIGTNPYMTSLNNPWTIAYVGSGTTIDELIDDIANPLKIGLWVGGRLKPSNGISKSDLKLVDDYYTEITVTYTVEAGDLALPVQLANAAGTGPAGGADDATGALNAQYYLYNDNLWKLYSTDTVGTISPVEANMSFGPTPLSGSAGIDYPTSWSASGEKRDITLAMAGMYVQTLDFDADYADADPDANPRIWRRVEEGGSATPVPSVVVDGGAADAASYYVWTDDTNSSITAEGKWYNGVLSEDGLTKVDHRVYTLSVAKGATSASFKIKGVTRGTTNRVFLASTPTNIFDGAGTVVTNFLVRYVACDEPSAPYVTFTLKKADGTYSDEATLSVSSDYKTPLSVLRVELSQAYTDSHKIYFAVSTNGNWACVEPDTWQTDPNRNYDVDTGDLIGLSTSGSDGAYADKIRFVEFKAGETAKDVNLYGLGADANVANFGFRIYPYPQYSSDFYKNGKHQGATLYLSEYDSAASGTKGPDVVTPENNSTLTAHAEKGSPYNVTVEVEDSYRDRLAGKYTAWYKIGASTVAKSFDVTSIANGRFQLPITFTTVGENLVQLCVVNVGEEPTWKTATSFKVVVDQVPTVTLHAAVGSDTTVFKEGSNLTYRVELNEVYPQGDALYAYLKPVDDATRALVKSDYLAEEGGIGIKIEPDSLVSSDYMTFSIDDGPSSYKTYNFDVVLCSTDNYAADKVVTYFTSEKRGVKITNVEPTVRYAKVGSSTVKNGQEAKTSVPRKVLKDYSCWASDPSTNDLTSIDKPFKTQWTFEESDGSIDAVNGVKVTYGKPDGQKVQYAFKNAGKAMVYVRVLDKDMAGWNEEDDLCDFESAQTFSFVVNVLDDASITMAGRYGKQFLESEAGADAVIDLGISQSANDVITMKLVVKAVGALDSTMPVLGGTGLRSDDTLPGVYYIDFEAGDTANEVYLKDLDGTQNSQQDGFTITASITNETTNVHGQKYCDMYGTKDWTFYVVNADPQIIRPNENTNAMPASIGVPVTITWSIKDVKQDMTNGLEVVISADGNTDQRFSTASGSAEVSFKSSGTKKVYLQVTDKDGGSATREWTYEIAASKQLYLLPHGPDRNAQCDLSTAYVTADGLGEGTVYSDTKLSGTSGSELQYAYDVTATSAKAYATATKNAGGLDSFFYAWVNDVADENGNYVGTATFSPETTATIAEKRIALPTESANGDSEDAVEVYEDRLLEAIFSKEWRAKDNLGDINYDGVPDYYAIKKYSGGWLYLLASGSGDGADSSSSTEEGSDGSDLTAVDGYNDDGDYFPAAWNYSNPIHPDKPGWGNGEPFSAYYEIRGVGPGLNAVINGTWLSDLELTEAETFALLADYFAAGQAAGENDAQTVDLAGAWARQNGWTIEAQNVTTGGRLDPTVEDSDSDGFPDGWEYFFWYYAKAGVVTDGKWERLTGRRFSKNPATFGQGVEIPSEQIILAFNPLVKRSVVADTLKKNGVTDVNDFDGDGLLDLEELVLGTNPVDWDSDNDGVSDYFEVMNGLDPLDSADGLRTGVDSAINPDRDFMAWRDYSNETYTVITFSDGSLYAVPKDAKASMAVGEEELDLFKFSSGTTNWYAETAPVTFTYGGKTCLAQDVTARLGVLVGETACAGAEVTVVAGTPIDAVGTAKESVQTATLGEIAFTRTNPGTEADEDWKNVGLKVFRYGKADGPLVPCAITVTNFEKWAELPTKDLAVTALATNQMLTLIHYQVFAQCGFDPRTAYARDDFGYVAARWHAASSEDSASEGDSGLAVDTVPYSNLDEFLFLQYRLNVPDLHVSIGTVAGLAWPDIVASMTLPNVPFSVESSADGSNTVEIAASTYETHGADTDEDGVPDGWELYVNANPLDKEDVKLMSGWANDKDTLSILEEFAGVDSCNWYTNRYEQVDGVETLVYPECSTITAHNPGSLKGWFNKFFPTNPYDPDTDGDGLYDSEEGSSWSACFYVGKNLYRGTSFTFIYGDDETKEKNAADMTTKCFRGGGLNPCTVDTDQDLLPDAWEYEFAGVVFTDGKTSADLDDLDVTRITAADGIQAALAETGTEIRGGMDGTNPNDHSYDFDHDGLRNWQEYMVQAMRVFRYDDYETPLMGVSPDSGKFVKFLPFQSWDAESYYKSCREAGFTATAAFKFRELGYFALPPHEWDRLRCSTKVSVKKWNYADEDTGVGAGYRVMLRPTALLPDGTRSTTRKGGAYSGDVAMYACTDPRQWDSDHDGMDDYWEIFHGLNPLLGTSADPTGRDFSNPNLWYDRIAAIYVSDGISSWVNGWTGWPMFASQPSYDPILHPWMLGTPDCDADGDGIRNIDEALQVNITTPAPSHTDPTPLWMTDSTSLKAASIVAQCYRADPYQTSPDVWNFPWERYSDLTFYSGDGALAVDGSSSAYLFAFEENEGYDTDHDYKSDNVELTHGVEAVSDPLDVTDPDRRQALYLPGFESAAVSRGATFRAATSTAYDLLRQFTVECWIKPEGAQTNAVVVERVSNYGPSTKTYADSVIRANFRLGFDATGSLYGEYEGSAANSGAVRVKGDVLADEWTHVALTFNGSTLTLYRNGIAVDVSSVGSTKTLVPANGIYIVNQEAGDVNFPVNEGGYVALPCATIVGARAVASAALDLTADTTWEAFGDYFKGYVDEVRVWDGARSDVEIREAKDARFSFADVSALRDTVYAAWKKGATRNDTTDGTVLPAELLQHYAFANVPGATDAANVIVEPAGFYDAVLGNVAVKGRLSLSSQMICGWWSETPVKSTVYANDYVVPWMVNTCAHLPMMDGSAVDSQYWSENFAGIVSAGTADGLSTYAFANSANPYPYFNFGLDRQDHYFRVQAAEKEGGVVAASSEAAQKYAFQLRSGFVGTSDLVPLGGAFAKRGADYWDGQGAMDAWTQTADADGYADADADGLPDWWAAYAEAHYGFDPTIADNADRLAQLVDYYGTGVMISAAEAYLRDLAEKGMLPDASTDTAWASRKDANLNGLPDWWENLYAMGDDAALEDADNDQLSNAAEYLIGEQFVKYPEFAAARVKPNFMSTFAGNGQIVPDYFLTVGSLYLGEMFADHDFIEDWWEDQYDADVASRYVYDALADADDDGWSNFAERRAETDPSRIAYLAVDEMTVNEFPVPTIKVTLNYNGDNAGASDSTVIVKAWRSDSINSMPDALWNVAVGGSTTSENASSSSTNAASTKLIGYGLDKEISVNLGPGSVVIGSISLDFKALTYYRQQMHYYYDANSNVTRKVVLSSQLGNPMSSSWATSVLFDRLRVGSSTEGDIVSSDTQEIVGSVDYETGLVTIDFSKVTGDYEFDLDYSASTWERSLASFANAYVRVNWTSMIPKQGFPMTVYLSNPEDASSENPSRGRLREGKNTFIAFLDVDASGTYTAGEPFGVAADVDVGWNSTAVEIELTETHASTFRLDLAQAAALITDSEPASQEDADQMGTDVNDRDVAGETSNYSLRYPGTTPVTATGKARVRIVRDRVNDVEVEVGGHAYNTDVLYDNVYDLTLGPVFSEADLFAAGLWDLDWDTLGEAWAAAHGAAASVANLTNASYRVVFGDGAIEPSTLGNAFVRCFKNEFERGKTPTKTVPVSVCEARGGTVFAGRPVFKWTHANSIGKSYPAFQLCVWTKQGELVYDSGIQRAPARNSNGVYSWAAPLYAGMVTREGKVFATTNDYVWAVGMRDAKFNWSKAAMVKTETQQAFRLECSGVGGAVTEYGSIDVRVKYFGPSLGQINVDPSVAANLVHVQAFESPDFTGTPVGEAWVNVGDSAAKTQASLSDPTALDVNATIRGVAPGTYYVRAFIDRDGDFERDAWESWGYCNYVGTSEKSVYEPQSVTVVAGSMKMPVADVYVEDMDMDNDGLPDAWEWTAENGLDEKISATGGFFTKVNPTLSETATELVSLDLLNGGAFIQAMPVYALLQNVASGNGSLATAFAADSQVLPEEFVELTISSFSLDAGLVMTVDAAVSSGESAFVVAAGKATVRVYLDVANNVDFSDATSIYVDTVTVYANQTTDVVVSAQKIREAIAAAGVSNASFVKARLSK